MENSSFRPSLSRRFLTALSHYTLAPHRLVFTSALAWHSLAARYFIITPFSTLRAVTHVRPITFTSAEILQYLGGLNIGYACLALQGLLLPQRDVEGRKRNALILAVVRVMEICHLHYIVLGKSKSGLVYN